MSTWVANMAADRALGTAPCKGCTDRWQSCWAECEKYQAWAKERSEFIRGYNSKEHEQKVAEDVRRSSVHKAIKRRGDKVCILKYKK